MDRIQRHLRVHGWAVIPGILTPVECHQLWSAFQEYSRVVADNILEAGEFDVNKKMYTVFGDIMVPSAISHAPFVRAVRDHPRVRDIWNFLCESNNLVCSMDTVNFDAPTRWAKRRNRKRFSSWYVRHRCHPSTIHSPCIQGFVDILGTPTVDHGGFRVIDQSHLDFHEYASRFHDSKWENEDWKRITPEMIQECMGCDFEGKILDLVTSPGSVILMDSRLIHAQRTVRVPTDPRFGVYVCYVQKQMLTTQDWKRRAHAEAEGRSTTCWPDARKLRPVQLLWREQVPDAVLHRAMLYNQMNTFMFK